MSPQHIESRLAELLENLHSWDSFGLPLLAQASRLHYEAVAIHPFPNGNGRWSRLLANIWLIRHDHDLTAWPEDALAGTSTIRAEYIQAMRAGDKGDEEPLLRLHQRYTEGKPTNS